MDETLLEATILWYDDNGLQFLQRKAAGRVASTALVFLGQPGSCAVSAQLCRSEGLCVAKKTIRSLQVGH